MNNNTKIVDSKGRLSLGILFANKTVIIDMSNPNKILLIPAIAIPEKECWLYKNKKAKDLVEAGLDEVSKY